MKKHIKKIYTWTLRLLFVLIMTIMIFGEIILDGIGSCAGLVNSAILKLEG